MANDNNRPKYRLKKSMNQYEAFKKALEALPLQNNITVYPDETTMVLTSDPSTIHQFSQQFIDEQEAAKKQLSSQTDNEKQKIGYAELERLLLSDSEKYKPKKSVNPEAAKKQLYSQTDNEKQKIGYAELERLLLSDDSEQDFINPEKAPSSLNIARQQEKSDFENSNISFQNGSFQYNFFQLGKRKYIGTEQESPPQKKQATKQNTGWQPVPETNKNLFDFSDAKFEPVYTPW